MFGSINWDLLEGNPKIYLTRHANILKFPLNLNNRKTLYNKIYRVEYWLIMLEWLNVILEKVILFGCAQFVSK